MIIMNLNLLIIIIHPKIRIFRKHSIGLILNKEIFQRGRNSISYPNFPMFTHLLRLLIKLPLKLDLPRAAMVWVESEFTQYFEMAYTYFRDPFNNLQYRKSNLLCPLGSG